MGVRRKLVRTTVEQLLLERRIRTPPIDIERIAKKFAEVQREPAEDDLSGFLFRDRQQDLAIIGVNSTHPPTRQTFTIAHELGHLLLHDIDEIHIDRRFNVWRRDRLAAEGTDVEEKEANLFAAELLMPVRFLEKNLEKIRTVDLLEDDVLRELAERYRVSTQAMTFRLAYLGHVTL